MPNKLRDIFTKKPLERKIRFEFSNEEGYFEFIEGLKRVGKEGCPVELEGVKTIHNTIGNGIVNYSNECEGEIVKSVIYPSKEPISVKLNTDFGEEEIILNRIKIDSGYLIIASCGSVVDFTLKINTQNDETQFSYKIDLKKADSIKNLIHNISIALAFCKYLFKNEYELKNVKPEVESQIVNINGVLDYLSDSLRIYTHLDYVNDKFALGIVPSDFGATNNFEDVEELYYSLNGTPIRSNENFSWMKTGLKEYNFENKEEILGKAVNLTFPASVTYDILGHEVTLYSANFLCNAVVADFEENSDKTGEVLLKPEKDKSMYIAYTAYETPEEVNAGLKDILNRLEEYYNAPTIVQLIARDYEKRTN